jgi:uroporphyrinogen-III decarboxylase
MNDFPGFIFNLGHGITPDINPAKVMVMIEATRA